MNVLELFSGTGSVGKVCEELGLNVISLDLLLPATHNVDIMDFDYKQYPKNYFSIIWSSPPCTAYSVLQNSWIGRKKKNGEIFTQEQQEKDMIEADKIVKKTLEIINYFDCDLWFMENPQSGNLKKRDFMKDIPYYDVDYCKYSDWGYRKRTRIWTNKQNFDNKLCNKDCGFIIEGKHINNLGNNVFKKNGKKVSKNFTLHERYRIPPDLIYSLILE